MGERGQLNSFEKCRATEERSMELLRPYIESHSFNGRFVVTGKGPLARDLQKQAGDVLVNTDEKTIYGVEIKAEEENLHGNLFLETWSNRARFTPGWMFASRADLLLYHFIKTNEVWRLDFERLRRWAFHENRIYDFPEKPQKKHDQLNDTWGRCVPTVVLESEVKARRIDLLEDGTA